MNTLKYKLLAASIFACSAAFAQGNANQQNGVPTTSTPTNTPNQFTPTAVGSRSDHNRYAEDAYVLQNGTGQYASVDQSGYYNTADIYQNYGNNGSSNYNNATQSQTNPGGTMNTAYIAQFGSSGNAAQTQNGSGNTASINQDRHNLSGTHNNATQEQQGNSNSADITQEGSNANAIQYQNGSSDVARITQGSASGNYAEQRQVGGNGNQANTTQSSPYATFSYTTQNGYSNQATVNQH
jgi:hypothetical protein